MLGILHGHIPKNAGFAVTGVVVLIIAGLVLGFHAMSPSGKPSKPKEPSSGQSAQVVGPEAVQMKSVTGSGSVVTASTPASSVNPVGSTTQPKSTAKGGSSTGGSGSSPSGSGSGSSSPSLLLAIPTYWYPPTSYDSQLTSAASHVGFVIANINSGPGTGGAQSNFQTMINNERAAGIKVYGYVYSQYGSRSLASVEADVASWYAWYNLDGILVDEAPNLGWTGAQQAYYQNLYNYIKGVSGSNVHGKTVVLNPGGETDQYAMSVSDVVDDYEDVEANYGGATFPSWTTQYPASRFWNIVYDSQGISQMQNDILLAKSRNVGYVFVTTATGGNPYNQLPSNPFWLDEINAL